MLDIFMASHTEVLVEPVEHKSSNQLKKFDCVLENQSEVMMQLSAQGRDLCAAILDLSSKIRKHLETSIEEQENDELSYYLPSNDQTASDIVNGGDFQIQREVVFDDGVAEAMYCEKLSTVVEGVDEDVGPSKPRSQRVVVGRPLRAARDTPNSDSTEHKLLQASASLADEQARRILAEKQVDEHLESLRRAQGMVTNLTELLDLQKQLPDLEELSSPLARLGAIVRKRGLQGFSASEISSLAAQLEGVVSVLESLDKSSELRRLKDEMALKDEETAERKKEMESLEVELETAKSKIAELQSKHKKMIEAVQVLTHNS